MGLFGPKPRLCGNGRDCTHYCRRGRHQPAVRRRSALTRISHNLRAPWLDLCPIRPFSILANTPGIGSGVKSLAGNPRSSSAKHDSAAEKSLRHHRATLLDMQVNVTVRQVSGGPSATRCQTGRTYAKSLPAGVCNRGTACRFRDLVTDPAAIRVHAPICHTGGEWRSWPRR